MATTRYSSKKKTGGFQKRIPENPRYKDVSTKIDTGASVSNYAKLKETLRKNYKIRQGEKFKRMKVSTFAQLIIQVADVVNCELERDLLESSGSELSANVSFEEENISEVDEEEKALETNRSTLNNVVRGVGEIDLNSKNNCNNNIDSPTMIENQQCAPPDPTCLPFLLLDVRDKDLYDRCHIIGALSYPSAMLTRSVNYLTKEMFTFKNKPGKIIVVYDDDERIAPEVATVLFEREMDNVILLSGGMKVLNKKFPGCFLSGTVPLSCFSPKLDRKGQPKPSPKIPQNSDVAWYTPDLLEQISEHLDNVLIENESRNSSCMSASGRSTVASSKASERSSVASRQNAPSSTRTWR